MRRLAISTLLVVAPTAVIADTPAAESSDIKVIELHVSGSVESSLVQSVVVETSLAVSHCYGAVQTKPTGTLAFKFRIDDNGAVATMSVTGAPIINTCIASKLKEVGFPTARGRVDIAEKVALPARPAQTRGILGSTALGQGGAFASLTGTGDSSSGFDDSNIYGGLLGHGQPRVVIGEPSDSFADKDAIRARLEGEISKIRSCYEKELVTHGDLAGTVTVKFHIESSGKVSSATGSGLAKVGTCVARVIAAIAFARPSAGAIDASYPFVFTSEMSGALGGPAARGSGQLKDRKGAIATVSIGQPDVKGDLDRAIIRRYIKRNFQKIQACYEKELLGAPKLAGTVTLSFRIEADGNVSGASASGIGASGLGKVGECVASAIQGIEFPKPKGGGTVEANYPFVFKPVQ